jgi:hypothetical protein
MRDLGRCLTLEGSSAWAKFRHINYISLGETYTLKTEVQKVLLLARKCTNGDSSSESAQMGTAHPKCCPICAVPIRALSC